MRVELLASIVALLWADSAVVAEAPWLQEARVSEVLDGDTMRVWLDGEEEPVRYLSIEAPELTEPGGQEARRAHEKLVAAGHVWLECEADDEGRPRRDGRRRLLAYVFADEKGQRCLNVELVRQGAAKIGVRAVKDDTPDNAFPLKRLDDLVAAQIQAAKSRTGCWDKADPHTESAFLVCFLKYWGKDEVCWLLNRGSTPVDLTAPWQLADMGEKNSVVIGQRVPEEELQLAPGGICRLHTGPDSKATRGQQSGKSIDLQWKRARVWNNTGDKATLRDPGGTVVYVYAYRASGN